MREAAKHAEDKMRREKTEEDIRKRGQRSTDGKKTRGR